MTAAPTLRIQQRASCAQSISPGVLQVPAAQYGPTASAWQRRGCSTAALAVMAALDDADLQERAWLLSSESDATAVINLRAPLAAEDARADRKWTLDEWFRKMRKEGEWGDGNTLIGATLFFQVRIEHAISTLK